MSAPEDPKVRGARWRQERREVAELRERIVLSGRTEGSRTPAVAYVYILVHGSDALMPLRPLLSAKELFDEADKTKLDGMSDTAFRNHVSAARNSRIPVSNLLQDERNTESLMHTARTDPDTIGIIAALWAEHEREKANLTKAESIASKFRTGRQRGAKARAK
jgi:hypothetical protein